jgi:hypothetical protein
MYRVSVEPSAALKEKLDTLQFWYYYDNVDNFIIHVENAQRLARLATLLAQFE